MQRGKGGREAKAEGKGEEKGGGGKFNTKQQNTTAVIFNEKELPQVGSDPVALCTYTHI